MGNTFFKAVKNEASVTAGSGSILKRKAKGNEGNHPTVKRVRFSEELVTMASSFEHDVDWIDSGNSEPGNRKCGVCVGLRLKLKKMEGKNLKLKEALDSKSQKMEEQKRRADLLEIKLKTSQRIVKILIQEKERSKNRKVRK